MRLLVVCAAAAFIAVQCEENSADEIDAVKKARNPYSWMATTGDLEVDKRAARNPYSWQNVKRAAVRNPYSWMTKEDEKRARNPYSWMTKVKRSRNPYSWMADEASHEQPRRAARSLLEYGEKRARNPYSWQYTMFEKRARNPYSWMNV